MLADELLRESLQIFNRVIPHGQLAAIREYRRKVEEYLREYADPPAPARPPEPPQEVVYPPSLLNRAVVSDEDFEHYMQESYAFLTGEIAKCREGTPAFKELVRKRKYLGRVKAHLAANPMLRREIQRHMLNFPCLPDQWQDWMIRNAPAVHNRILIRI